MSRLKATSTWNRWQGECHRNPSERHGSCPRAPCPQWTEPSPFSLCKMHLDRRNTGFPGSSRLLHFQFTGSTNFGQFIHYPVRVPASLFVEQKHTPQLQRANKNRIESSTTKTLLTAVSLGDVCLQVEAAEGLGVTCY